MVGEWEWVGYNILYYKGEAKENWGHLRRINVEECGEFKENRG